MRLLLAERERLLAAEDVRRAEAVAMGAQWAWSGKDGSAVFKKWSAAKLKG